jgi:predicted enzyme related to lactoylglutathione lyase
MTPASLGPPSRQVNRRPARSPRTAAVRDGLTLIHGSGPILAGMAVLLHHIVIDAHDLPALARFWTRVLGWQILSEREREIVIGPEATAPLGICFMPVTDRKVVKNRVHLDLTTGAGERDAEIERILALGARRVDIGQTGTESWTVLADPEGNEFCVVRPKTTLVG